MSYSHTDVIDNAGVPFYLYWYKCDKCSKEISDAWPRYEDKEKDIHYCRNCSFILGLIDEETFLQWCGIHVPEHFHAAVIDGEIETWTGKSKVPPSQRTKKESRRTGKYMAWRKAVYERDDYTCQHCGQRGGKLNAHHVKSFAKYKELRYDIENGITLCEPCHDKAHGKKRKKAG